MPSLAAPPQVGDLAPDAIGYDAENQQTSPASYRGKVVVVSFWASWCPPCLKEMPILESIQKTAGKRQIQVIAVNTELLDTYRRLARKLADFELTVTHDAGNRTAKAYDVNGIPHRIIIDRTGHIVRIHRGYREDALDEIVADINQALRARNTPPDAVKDAVPR